MRLWRYLKNILIAFDQLINTFCFGDPDETISSRVGKRRDSLEKLWAAIINKLFFWQKDHTAESVEHDEGKDSIM